MHSALMRFLKKPFCVCICPVTRRNHIIISHVVSRIPERGKETRINPERVAAKLLNIIQLFNNPLHVPDSVRIRIIK